MGHDGRGIQKIINKHHYPDSFPTFRNALAEHKLEALATFLSAKYEMDMHPKYLKITVWYFLFSFKIIHNHSHTYWKYENQTSAPQILCTFSQRPWWMNESIHKVCVCWWEQTPWWCNEKQQTSHPWQHIVATCFSQHRHIILKSSLHSALRKSATRRDSPAGGDKKSNYNMKSL